MCLNLFIVYIQIHNNTQDNTSNDKKRVQLYAVHIISFIKSSHAHDFSRL